MSFVSRAGLKLQHALDTFGIDVRGLRCADFGCNVGGFTECLLRAGAAGVIAVDTGYNVIDFSLRRDERVDVRERTNALHAEAPEGGVDLVVIDLGWTPQRHALPAAARWLRAGGRVVTLVKPHYELTEEERGTLLVDGLLAPDVAGRVFRRVVAGFAETGFEPLAETRSPVTGGKSARRHGGAGNVEFLVLARPCGAREGDPQRV